VVVYFKNFNLFLGEEVINKYKKDEGYLIDSEANSGNLPKNRLKRLIWLLYEYPHSSIYARIIAVISVIVIVISISLFCIETLPERKSQKSTSELLYTSIQTTSIYSSNNENDGNSQEKIAISNLTSKKDQYFLIETICIIWFSVELILRFFATPNKLAFVKHTGNIIDFFSILPYFMSVTDMSEKFSILRIIRLVRVFRIFKLARHFKGLQILAHTLR
jgi:potassium voltage-gated channel Shaker-related subfamily A protein 4